MTDIDTAAARRLAAEARAVADAATPGPWGKSRYAGDIIIHTAIEGNNITYMDLSKHKVCEFRYIYDVHDEEQMERDFAFIVATRELVPALAAELNRLAAALDAARWVQRRRALRRVKDGKT